MPRPVPTHTASASHIFTLKLGGGLRNRIAICAYAVVAAKNGWRVLPMDRYGNDGEIPDLVIEKEDRMRDGSRRWNEKLRYRVEVIDTHDPVPDYKPGDGGYQDCVKVFLKKGYEYCGSAHGNVVGDNLAERLASSETALEFDGFAEHPLCLDGLIWLCERNLP